MAAWIFEMAFCAALALFATRISWRTALGFVGLTLLLGTIVSDIAYFNTSLSSRLIVQIVVEIVIVRAARMAVFDDGKTPARLVMALAAIDVAYCGTISGMLATGRISEAWADYIFGTGDNILFYAQCFATAAPGIRNAYLGWLSRIADRRSLDSAHPDHDWLLSRLDREE